MMSAVSFGVAYCWRAAISEAALSQLAVWPIYFIPLVLLKRPTAKWSQPISRTGNR